MQLFASPTSPYARLARIVVLEKGLEDRVSVQMVNPWENDAALVARNPFSRIPTLVTDDETVLTESSLVALYLDRLEPTPTLLPEDRMAPVLRKLGLAQGALDAAVGVIAPRKFHGEAANDDPLVQRRLNSLRTILPTLAGCGLGNPGRPDLGDLAVAVALFYLDFRLPEIDVAGSEPGLATWRDGFADRPSFRATEPPAG
jgi:glutathione S-transferase